MRSPSWLRDRRSGILAAAIGTVTWGSAGVLAGLAELPSAAGAGYRLWIGAVFMLGLATLSGQWPSYSILRATVGPGVLFALSVVLFFAALETTTVAAATIIAESLKPIVVLALARWLLGEHASRTTVGWSLVAVGGAVVVAVAYAGGLGGQTTGNALAAGALLSGAGVTVLSRRARSATRSREFMSALLLVASLTITPFLVASGTAPGDIPLASGLWLVLLAVLPGGVGYLLMVFALGHVDAGTCAVIASATPVVAALLARFCLGETIPPLVGLGGGVVVLAAGAVARSSGRPRGFLAACDHTLPTATSQGSGCSAISTLCGDRLGTSPDRGPVRRQRNS